jgi:hypothetical protein
MQASRKIAENVPRFSFIGIEASVSIKTVLFEALRQLLEKAPRKSG